MKMYYLLLKKPSDRLHGHFVRIVSIGIWTPLCGMQWYIWPFTLSLPTRYSYLHSYTLCKLNKKTPITPILYEMQHLTATQPLQIRTIMTKNCGGQNMLLRQYFYQLFDQLLRMSSPHIQQSSSRQCLMSIVCVKISVTR